MTVTELLEKIRDFYLARFKQEINEQIANGFEIVIEPELLDKSGLTITEGFFKTPYRNDLFVFKDKTLTDSIMVDTDSRLSFSPITLQWSDTLKVTIEPFQWNLLTLEFFDKDDHDWAPLKSWFLDSFKEKEESEGLRSVVHYMSDPYNEDDKIRVDIDLGSATINHFENLLDSLDKMELTKVTVK